jgi:hypothetical protein
MTANTASMNITARDLAYRDRGTPLTGVLFRDETRPGRQPGILADVTAFAAEMDQAGADWQLNVYGGALHGFTHSHAQPGAVPGVAYHQQADQRSFAATRDFLASALAAPTPS